MANYKEVDSMLTTSDVSHLLNVHINTVRRWSNQGVLKAYSDLPPTVVPLVKSLPHLE